MKVEPRLALFRHDVFDRRLIGGLGVLFVKEMHKFISMLAYEREARLFLTGDRFVTNIS